MSFNIRLLDNLDYDDVEPILGDYIDGLINEFVNSKIGKAYVKKNPEGGWWIGTFIEMGYMYGERTPPKMTKGDVQQLMEYTLPRKITLMDPSETEDAIPELVAFWTFLKEDYKLRSASAIAKYLLSIEDKFSGWMFDPARGGIAKNFITQGIAAGYDMETQEGMEAFQAEYNRSLKAGERPPLNNPMGLPAGLPQDLSQILAQTPSEKVPMTAPPPEAAAMMELMGIELPEIGSMVDPADFISQILDATKKLGAVLGEDVAADPDIVAMEQLLAETKGELGEELGEALKSALSGELDDDLDDLLEPISEADIALLESQTVSATEPGTIVQDFQMLLDAIASEGITVSGKRRQLPMKQLEAINQRLAEPIQIALKRPQQKSYPPIHGLYMLLKATGLVSIVGKGKQQRLMINPEPYEVWQQMNATERYCTLLEAWIVRSHGEMIGEPPSFKGEGHDCLQGWPMFASQKKRSYSKGYGDENMLKYYPGYHNLALMALFGLVTIQLGKPEKGKGWRIKSVEILPFGDALMKVLRNTYVENYFSWDSFEEPALPFEELMLYLDPYFPEWETMLPGIPAAPFSPGRHIFKVSLGKVWRRIAISGAATLEQFGALIRESVKFDSDHLDRFTYENNMGRHVIVMHPYVDDGEQFTDEITVGSLPLKEGDTLEYLFDFGDRWKFEAFLETIEPEPEQGIPKVKSSKRSKKSNKPKAIGEILESHGEAPEQYPDSDR